MYVYIYILSIRMYFMRHNLHSVYIYPNYCDQNRTIRVIATRFIVHHTELPHRAYVPALLSL